MSGVIIYYAKCVHYIHGIYKIVCTDLYMVCTDIIYLFALKDLRKVQVRNK